MFRKFMLMFSILFVKRSVGRGSAPGPPKDSSAHPAK